MVQLTLWTSSLGSATDTTDPASRNTLKRPSV